MNCKILSLTFFLSFSLGIVGCGGGDVSEFSDDDLPSPVAGGIDDDGNLDPSAPGSNPVSGEDLANLPQINAGNKIFADPNVLVTLNGTATAREGSTIVQTLWTQVSGPEVVIPSPNLLSTSIVVPDILEQTQLVFRLTAVDSENRVNSSTASVIVKPSPAFARVVGEVAEVGQLSVVFKVRLNAVQTDDVSINYETEDGTALAGIDYEAEAGTLVIPAGQSEAEVTVNVLPGSFDGADETFIMRITVVSETQNSSSNAGVVLLRDIPGMLLPAPSLVAPEPLSFALGELITPFILVNDGGTALSRCELGDSSLPLGLSVAVTEDATSCVITGTPSVLQAASISTIVATNAAGIGAVDVSIAVVTDLVAPVLADLDDQILLLGESIESLAFVNSGGGAVSCEFLVDDEGPAPPSWLSVAPSADQSTCVLSGTATELGITPLTVLATNAVGSATAAVAVDVQAPLAPPELIVPSPLVVPVGSEIAPVTIDNIGGGELTLCQSDGVALPTGLVIAVSADARVCEISGTPTEVTEGPLDVTISAENAAGQSTITVSFEITVAPPAIADPALQVYFVSETITPLVLSTLPLTPLSSCTPVDTLPSGLVVSIGNDGSSCVISGGATTPSAAQDYIIRAANAAGTDDVSVNIEVRNLVQRVDFVLADGDEVCSLGLATSAGTATVDWNDGSVNDVIDNRDVELIDAAEAGALEHRFAGEGNPGSFSVTFSRGVASLTALADNGCAYDFDVTELLGAEDLQVLKLTGVNGNLNGNLATLAANHPQMRELEIVRVPSFSFPPSLSGQLSELPPNLERFSTTAGVNFSANAAIADVPTSLTELSLEDINTTVVGSIENLPGALTSLSVTGFTSIDGDLSGLRPDMRLLDINGFNNISGSVSSVVNDGGLFLALNGGTSTLISAEVSGIPSSITGLVLDGSIPVVGDIEDLHPDMVRFFMFSDQTTISGDISTLRSNGPIEVSVLGSNTITGNIDDVFPEIVSLEIGGNNTVTGDIAGIHSNFERLSISGQNSISGDIGLIQANNLVELVIGGENLLIEFSGAPTWAPTQLVTLDIFGGGPIGDGGLAGYSSSEVDNILVYLNSQLPGINDDDPTGVISLNRIGDSPPSALSNLAITELRAKNYSVITNTDVVATSVSDLQE